MVVLVDEVGPILNIGPVFRAKNLPCPIRDKGTHDAGFIRVVGVDRSYINLLVETGYTFVSRANMEKKMELSIGKSNVGALLKLFSIDRNIKPMNERNPRKKTPKSFLPIVDIFGSMAMSSSFE